jgi:hypothetical protein
VVLSCRWPHGVAGGGAAERLAEERRFVRDREERSLRHCARVISGGMVDSIGTTDWRASCSEIEGGVGIALLLGGAKVALLRRVFVRLRARVDAMPGGERVRVMEDVQRRFPIGNLDAEPVAGLPVGDRDDHAIVTLVPEEPDIDAVVGAVAELVEVIAHGVPTVPSAALRLNAARPSSASGWLAT